MNSLFKKAFTLIEVNLAIFIMAGGVLAMISLYSLGFRESRQSREDVASSAMADARMTPTAIPSGILCSVTAILNIVLRCHCFLGDRPSGDLASRCM